MNCCRPNKMKKRFKKEIDKKQPKMNQLQYNWIFRNSRFKYQNELQLIQATLPATIITHRKWQPMFPIETFHIQDMISLCITALNFNGRSVEIPMFLIEFCCNKTSIQPIFKQEGHLGNWIFQIDGVKYSNVK